MENDLTNGSEPIEFPIDGILDLHTFRPKDVKELVPEYIDACLKRSIFQIRIIHGKGTGALRKTVHSILEKHPDVISFLKEEGKDVDSIAGRGNSDSPMSRFDRKQQGQDASS